MGSKKFDGKGDGKQMIIKGRMQTITWILLFGSIILVSCNNEATPHDEHITNQEEHQMEHENGDQDQEQTPDMNEEFAKPPENFNEQASENLTYLQTKNVTRLGTEDPIDLSILVSQTIWPSTHEQNQPGTVILVPNDNWQIALASTNLIHHPNDGPVFFIKSNSIPDSVLNEINRLQPKGNSEGVEIMIMGEVSENVLTQLNDFKVQHLEETEPAAFARDIDRTYSNLTNDVPNQVIIGSMEEEDKLYTMIAANWIAHMAEPLLYVSSDNIPEATIEALEERNDEVQMYLLGPNTVISDEVANQLEEFGSIVRINGDTPTQTAIEFAKFKDKETNFGWGITGPGHGISFISTETQDLAIIAAPFSHLGKHAPLLWLENGELTNELYEYLALLKPTFEIEPTEGPYNHAFIMGSVNNISFQVQGIIDEKLEIVAAGGKGHGDH